MRISRATVAAGFVAVLLAGQAVAQTPGVGPDPRGGAGLDLGLREAGPRALTVGQTATFILNVTNGGPSAAGPGDVEVASSLPAGLAASAASGQDWSCQVSASMIACQYAGPAVGPGGALPPVAFSARAVAAGSFVQCASVRAVRMEDLRQGDNRACVDGRIGAAPERIDLAIQTRGPGPLTAGQTGNFTLLVRNQGQTPVGAAYGVQVIARPPQGFTAPFGGSGPNWNCGVSNGTLTCGYGGPSVEAGSSLPPISLFARAGGHDAYVQCAEVRVARGDINPVNNRACVRDLLRPGNNGGSDLSVRETGPAALVVGQAATFVLWPRNNGPTPVDVADEVTISDTLPLVFGQAQASGSGWTCIVSSGSPAMIRCVHVGPPVGPGAPLPNITITAVAKSDGPYLHCAAIGRRGASDPKPDDNRVCHEGRVMPEGRGHDIGVAMRALGPTEGRTVKFALNPYNTGGASVNAASEIRLVATLSAIFGPPTVNAGPGWSCAVGENPHIVSCGYAGPAVWANDQLPQVIITAIAREPGPYRNCVEIDLRAAPDLNPRDNRSCVEGEVVANAPAPF